MTFTDEEGEEELREVSDGDGLNLRQLTIETGEGLARKFSSSELGKLVQHSKEQVSGGYGAHNLRAINESSVIHSPKRPSQRESRLLVLHTGGTIGMRTDHSGVYVPEACYLPKAIRDLPPLNDKDYVEEHYGGLDTRPYCLPPVRGMRKRVVYWMAEYEPLLDSSDLTFDDWIRIASDIKKSYSVYDGFVILHGTDTLAYTACALSFMLENLGKPVVLTGAQIPVSEVRSDGRENMIGALIVAGNFDVPEVTVLFNNKLLRGNRCIKVDSRGMDAFNSPNMPPLATMDIDICVSHENVFRSAEVAPFDVCESLCRNVVVLRIYPSIPIAAVRASLHGTTEGVVLQTFGSGNMPLRRQDIMHEIREAVKRGCLVVNVSQCMRGRVAVTYASSKPVRDAGVILGSDMTTEAALTKLAYVLGKCEWDLPTKRLMMSRNLRGELTVDRSERLTDMDIVPKLAKFLGVTSGAEARLLRNALYPPLVCYAAYNNDVGLLESLRLSGADVTVFDYHQRTALHVAARVGNLEAVEYLLRHGASVHARDWQDENTLLGAVQSRNLRVIRAIREAGGQLTASSARVGVELCMAAGQADLPSLAAWVEAGADCSVPDYDRRTALHVAVGKGLLTVVEFLRNNGADPLVRDCFGATPVEECERARRSQLAAAVEADNEAMSEETRMKIADNFDRILLALKTVY